MTNKTTNLPIFPLDVFLLPGGITRLRIFEAKYLKMVGLSSTLGGFIISSNKQQHEPSSRWGSWVEIINFDNGDDGVLEIDVKCKSLVELTMVESEIDNLQFASISEINHWSEKQSSTHLILLSESLLSVFENNDLLNDLYSSKLINNPYWVVSRWLELLPIPHDVKHNFVFNSSYVEAKKLVNSIISKEI
ncbi:LON peptidase substrate-binding domain-containing protein [uncultured Psychromonas sp.]|uniref:LON peptidase substrate-binding domain-containing protein n=1 Tax=uncultured Psychromonas sp. TaxID=173974 RepID=UPI002613E9E8|nr:LON peptidase substrate-binding domain-containing protein [uncultured Psychromonas sp.]